MENITTYFAPAERASEETVRAQRATVLSNQAIQQLGDSIPDIAMLLNRERQLVYGNARLLELLGLSEAGAETGARPGELFRCVNAGKTPGGCGTSHECRNCGMVLAVLASGEKGERVVRECRLARKTDSGGLEFLDFQVWVSPLDISGGRYSLVAVSDIGAQKRLSAMDKIFYHDLLGAVGGLLGAAEVLKDGKGGDAAGLIGDVHELAASLVGVIKTQGEIIAAERNRLMVNPAPFAVAELVASVAKSYKRHPVGVGKHIEVAPCAQGLAMESDVRLIGRALGNLVKNALEAARQGEAVRLEVVESGDFLEFRVHNPGVIPAAVQPNIFTCDYSTKGVGRGLGTYCVKLISERYLNGSVRFHSEAGAGTTFFLRLPRSFSHYQNAAQRPEII